MSQSRISFSLSGKKENTEDRENGGREWPDTLRFTLNVLSFFEGLKDFNTKSLQKNSFFLFFIFLHASARGKSIQV